MEIGIRLHDTAGSNLEEHLRNAREQGFSCVHIAMSKVVPGFKMADAPELLTDALADEVRGLLEKYNQRCVLLGCYLNLCSPDLSAHERTLMKDIAMLDQMYELNLKYYKELTMYIIAGKKRLAEVRSGELEELRKKAEASGLAEDAQAYNDYAQKCERFEKKLHDLELTRMVSLQMGPQTRLLQNNDTLMVEKIQSSLVNTIPLWKSQMVLALGMEHSRQATAAQSAVAQTTNELLKKNADMLKMGTIATAKEAERSIVDIETLQHTNEQLVSTLDEVVNIQREGAQKRKEAEVELGRIEGELKQKLMELRS